MTSHNLHAASAPEAASTQGHALPRVVIGGLDDTHMGPALCWLAAHFGLVPGDRETLIDDIKSAVPAADSLRSAIEVLLSLAVWVAERTTPGEQPGDGGAAVLEALARDPFLPPSQQTLCADLAAAVARDRHCASVAVQAISVRGAMSVVIYVMRAIEHRFGFSPAQQVHTYRQVALTIYEGSW